MKTFVVVVVDALVVVLLVAVVMFVVEGLLKFTFNRKFQIKKKTQIKIIKTHILCFTVWFWECIFFFLFWALFGNGGDYFDSLFVLKLLHT